MTELTQIADKIMSALGDKAMTTAEIAIASGLELGSVSYVISKLEVRRKVSLVGKKKSEHSSRMLNVYVAGVAIERDIEQQKSYCAPSNQLRCHSSISMFCQCQCQCKTRMTGKYEPDGASRKRCTVK